MTAAFIAASMAAASVSAGSLLQALAPELLLSAGAMAMLMAAVWHAPRPHNALAGMPSAAMAEGGERTIVLARFGMVLCLVTALVVLISWGDGAMGTADGRIAGDGYRWAMSLVVLLGAGLSLALIEQEHHRSGAFGPETPVLLLLATVGMLVLTAARDLMPSFSGSS
jgi:NADH-quinone oxidoreductase subunit N